MQLLISAFTVGPGVVRPERLPTFIICKSGTGPKLRGVLCSAETSYSITQHSFPANIRDASRPKCPQPLPDNCGAVDVSGAAAEDLASAYAQGFPDPGSNVAVLYYSEPSRTAESFAGGARFSGIMKSRHSRRMVPISRSQYALAFGARIFPSSQRHRLTD